MRPTYFYITRTSSSDSGRVLCLPKTAQFSYNYLELGTEDFVDFLRSKINLLQGSKFIDFSGRRKLLVLPITRTRHIATSRSWRYAHCPFPVRSPRRRRLVASSPLPSAQACPKSEITKEITKESRPQILLLFRTRHDGRGERKRLFLISGAGLLCLRPPLLFPFPQLLEFLLQRLALCVSLSRGWDQSPASPHPCWSRSQAAD